MDDQKMSMNFWKDRRVFLTGHTGFKGGWLSSWLQSKGALVTGYSLAPKGEFNFFNVAQVSRGMVESHEADIRDLLSLKSAMLSSKPEVVIHMAAQALVRQSYRDPVETYSTNVMGTVNLFEAVRTTSGVRAVVNITTDKCYENKEWEWAYREIDPLGGFDPYSNSKGCAEMVTSAYRNSFFNPMQYQNHGVAIATVRAGNVIGGGDWSADRLIPDILSAFEKRQPVQIRNPNAIRPWQHVLEPLRGYMLLARCLVEKGPAFGDSWNFGPLDDDARSVEWIVKQMANRWGDGAHWQIDQSEQPHEANYLKLDISKARSRLLWEPTLRLTGAIDLVIQWTKEFRANADMRDVTLQQILKYQKLNNVLSLDKNDERIA
jgi:CDP-glucose 4,6-dehydratase